MRERAREQKARPEPVTGLAENRVTAHLQSLSRPAERVAFVILLLGIGALFMGLLAYWADRGFYFDQLKYDFAEIFFEDIRYRRGWSQWCARIGLVLGIVGYVVAYHFERFVSPLMRRVTGLLRWVRTGE